MPDPSTRVQSLMDPGQCGAVTDYAQAFVMQDGSVRTNGLGDSGQLGTGSYQSPNPYPFPVSFDEPNLGPMRY